MENIYQFVSSLDILWVASAAILLIILDIFIIGSTALLLVSVSFFIFIALYFLIDDPMLLTWSYPAVVILLFILQRFLINTTIRQKLPNEEIRTGKYNAVVKEASNPDDSKNYFYGYKDQKQAVVDNDNNSKARYKALLEDGRSYMLPEDPKLFDGQKIKILVTQDEIAKVVKYYE
jgi:membrane protein implicated in regulation of membrane protease activity